MKHKCLIIDDDAAIRRVACSVADSLSHAHVEAGSQESARKRLSGVTYILLDLEIPEKDSRGFPRIQNGLNLLEEFVGSPETASIPVIVMTAHGTTDPTLAVEVLTAGASNWINKPFPATGKTLDKVIKETLSKRTNKSILPNPKNRPALQFEGGELSFQTTHVTLLGHKVAGSDSIMRNVLEELSVKDSRGKFVNLSAEEFAKRFRCDGGQNTITSTISDFRKKVSQVLLDRAGVTCGENDVIESVNGYRFKEWISIADGSVELTQSAVKNTSPAPEQNTLESRRKWILEQLESGVQLRVGDITKVFKCSNRTALRDTEALKQSGQIKYQGDPLDGHYVLCK